MKILFISMSLELGCKDLYCDLIDSLLKRNHNITVVRSLPNITNTTFQQQESGLSVLDVKTGDPFSQNLLKKGLNQIMIGTYLKHSIFPRCVCRNRWGGRAGKTPDICRGVSGNSKLRDKFRREQ